MFLARFQALLRAHRSSWDLSSIFSVGTSLMRNFDIYFSQRWSFLFHGYSHDVALTLWTVPFELVPRLSASSFPETFYLEKRAHMNLVIHNPIVIHFSQQPQHSCRRFFFFCGTGSSFSACCLVVRCDAGTNAYTRLYIPFLLCRIDIQELPILTRRSRTFQIISAQSSKNGPMVTFASDTSFPRHMCGGNVFWILRTILGLVAETATVSLRTLATFFHWKQIPFPPSTPDNPFRHFDHCSCFDFPVAGVTVS